MMVEALLLLVVVLLVLRPLVQKQRERALAERLKKTRSAAEAAFLVDDAIRANKGEGDLLEKIRQSYGFWLR